MRLIKPSPNAIMVPGHPVARGCRLALIFNEESGTYTDYSFLRQPVQRSNATTAIPKFPIQGQGINGVGIGASWNYNQVSAAEVDILRQGPAKVTAQNSIISVTASFILYSTANQSIIFSLGMRIDSNEAMFLGTDVAGAGILTFMAATGPTIIAGKLYTVGISQTSATARRWFVNGAVTTNATNVGTTSIGATNPYTFGANYTNAVEDAGKRMMGHLNHVFIHDYAITDDLKQSIHSDPYGAFILPKRKWFTIPAASTVTGDGSVTSGPASVSGAGIEIITGTGSIVSGVASVSGTGVEIIIGAGSVTSGAASVSGAGSEILTGAGSVTSGAASVSGAGSEILTGTGAVTSGAASADGAGSEVFTGTGGASSGFASVSGAGSEILTGTGGVTSGSPTVGGAGTETITGSGGIVSGGAGVSGAGDGIVTGTGSVTAGGPTVAGSGSIVIVGSGGAVSGLATVSGTEVVASHVFNVFRSPVFNSFVRRRAA